MLTLIPLQRLGVGFLLSFFGKALLRWAVAYLPTNQPFREWHHLALENLFVLLPGPMFFVDGAGISDASRTDRMRLYVSPLGLHMLHTAMPLIRVNVAFTFDSRACREPGRNRHLVTLRRIGFGSAQCRRHGSMVANFQRAPIGQMLDNRVFPPMPKVGSYTVMA